LKNCWFFGAFPRFFFQQIPVHTRLEERYYHAIGKSASESESYVLSSLLGFLFTTAGDNLGAPRRPSLSNSALKEEFPKPTAVGLNNPLNTQVV